MPDNESEKDATLDGPPAEATIVNDETGLAGTGETIVRGGLSDESGDPLPDAPPFTLDEKTERAIKANVAMSVNPASLTPDGRAMAEADLAAHRKDVLDDQVARLKALADIKANTESPAPPPLTADEIRMLERVAPGTDWAKVDPPPPVVTVIHSPQREVRRVVVDPDALGDARFKDTQVVVKEKGEPVFLPALTKWAGIRLDEHGPGGHFELREPVAVALVKSQGDRYRIATEKG